MMGAGVLSILVLDVPGQHVSIVTVMRFVRSHVQTLSHKRSEFSALTNGGVN
jgi:hypothetical protein